MRRTATLVVLAICSPLLAACGSSPTCDDLDSIAEQLARTTPDDPDYNDLVERADLAAADCNAR